MRLNGVAVRPLKGGIDIQERLRIVLTRGKVGYVVKWITANGIATIGNIGYVVGGKVSNVCTP